MLILVMDDRKPVGSWGGHGDIAAHIRRYFVITTVFILILWGTGLANSTRFGKENFMSSTHHQSLSKTRKWARHREETLFLRKMYLYDFFLLPLSTDWSGLSSIMCERMDGRCAKIIPARNHKRNLSLTTGRGGLWYYYA